MLRKKTSYLGLATYFRVVSNMDVSIIYDLFLWNECMVAVVKEARCVVMHFF